MYNWFYPVTYSEISTDELKKYTKYPYNGFTSLPNKPKNRSLYFHIPFCQDICAFCPFTREILTSNDYLEQYVDALITEIKLKSSIRGISDVPITSIFFGGGTPSILHPKHILRIGKAIHEGFDLSHLKEFSFEMNAKTVRQDLVDALKEIGVTHARMGVQTFNPIYRSLFKLSATIETIEAAVELLNNNFNHVCVDILYGMHGQRVDDFLKDLNHSINLNTSNIDVYPINNSVIQERLKQEYISCGMTPMTGLSKFSFNIILNQYMRANGYLPHNGHGYVKSSSKEILKNPVTTRSYTFQYHETVYGYKGHELIAFGVAGYSIFDNIIMGNVINNKQYISMLQENMLPLIGVATYPSWMSDIKGITSHLPYHGFAKKELIYNIDDETLEKIDFLKKTGLLIETSDEYMLSQTGWYNYVNLLYYLSPTCDQEALKKMVEISCPDDPWTHSLDF